MSTHPIPTDSSLHFQSATTLAGLIRDGELGARELLDHLLARIDLHNSAINAVVMQDRDAARACADAADAARLTANKNGQPLPPLHGLPMTVKESFQVRGWPHTWGIPALRDNLATQDALAIQRLRAAGANVFGKTNVPIRLADFQSYNAVYGTTQNPWRSGHTPGGSSGGSAAALAAGFTTLELGSDIGGSIRNPAHFCGVFGHKPTWGLLPPRGHSVADTLAPSDISVIGPLARSADDLATAVRLLAGPDVLEADGLQLDLPELDAPLKGLRIAVWGDDPICPVSSAVRDRLQAVAATLAAQGAQVDDQARPEFKPGHSHRVYQALLQSAMAARLPDDAFDALVAQAAQHDSADQSPAAMTARWQTLRARDWLRLNEQRTQLRWAWHRFFQRHDFLLAPVMPSTAFAHDHSPEDQRTVMVDGRPQDYFSQIFWAGLAGVAYLPATVVPAGLAPDGLPVGIQIIGPAYGDLRTIGLAQRLQALGFGFQPPPGL